MDACVVSIYLVRRAKNGKKRKGIAASRKIGLLCKPKQHYIDSRFHVAYGQKIKREATVGDREGTVGDGDVTKTRPLVTETRRLVTETRPLVMQRERLVTKTRRLVTETRRLVTRL